jgi:hypothetical protein
VPPRPPAYRLSRSFYFARLESNFHDETDNRYKTVALKVVIASMNISGKESSVTPNKAQRYGFISECAGTVTIVAGLLVLTGWLLGIRPLLSVMPTYVTMKPNTAFCFVLGGLALWLLRFPRSQQAVGITPQHCRFGQVCALLVAFLSLLTLGEYFCNLNLGIDQALLPDTLTDARVSFPGRMSISTAIGFCLLGSSLFFLGTKHARGALMAPLPTYR